MVVVVGGGAALGRELHPGPRGRGERAGVGRGWRV